MSQPFWKRYGTMDEFIKALLLRMKEVGINENLIPDTTTTRDIGSTTAYFRHLYLQRIYADYAQISAIEKDFLPNADDTYDVGSATKEWTDGFFDGILHADALALDNVVTKTTTYTATINDSIILVTTAAGWTLTLPAAATATGQVLIIKKTDAAANALTIDGNAAETIDGAATNAEIDAQYDCLMIICDGTGWHIIGRWIH